MIRGLALCAAATLVMAVPSTAKEKPPHVYGPPPEWEDFRKIAEAGLTTRLLDPESARITWTDGYHKGEYKPFLEARVRGYVACGQVNSRNRMGGYVGAYAFAVVIDYDKLLYLDIGSPRNAMVDAQCAIARKAGLFPPLPTTNAAGVATPSVADLATSSSGLSLRAMPEGAYVSAVAAGSLAAAAGFKPGMVITSVNAIPLAGMGDAMMKVMNAAGSDASFAIVGGSTLKLTPAKQP